eukprot:1184151-Prorocentrum_minimum.AAC.7
MQSIDPQSAGYEFVTTAQPTHCVNLCTDPVNCELEWAASLLVGADIILTEALIICQIVLQ